MTGTIVHSVRHAGPMDTERSSSPADRVWSRLPAGAADALRDGLTPTDLNSLLLDVARARATRVTPARLVERWRDDRFVRPAAADPRRLAQATARLWELLPPSVVGLELSPVTPLGTCSAVAPVDQHRIVSTVRGTEVVSDPTNVLALEAARRRRSGEPRVDLAAAHRVLRGQVFHDPEAYSHFLLFVLVSSAGIEGIYAPSRTCCAAISTGGAPRCPPWRRASRQWRP